MFKLILITALLALSVLATSHADTEMEMIRDVVNLYQPNSMKRFGAKIQIILEQDHSTRNAYASVGPGRPPKLGITTGALYALRDDAVLATMCHELGHFFGNTQFAIQPGNPLSMIVEAEADYFTGACLVNYLRLVKRLPSSRAVEEAIEIAKMEAPAFARKRIVSESAYSQTYTEGWNTSYPPDECRLLTVIHGVRGWKRPSCWYNPK